MKKSILALCALTVAAGLSACGGGKSSYTIGGTVTGLQYGPLVLTTNGMEVNIQPVLDANGNPTAVAYTFPNQLEYGEEYNVTLKETGKDSNNEPIYQQPPHQKCDPSGITKDVAGRLTYISADIHCVLVTNTIGGTIVGLTGEGLKLINGSAGGTLDIAKDAKTFTFAKEVTYGQTYGVTILAQPTGQTCSVANGTNKMGDTAVDTIVVTCVNNPT